MILEKPFQKPQRFDLELAGRTAVADTAVCYEIMGHRSELGFVGPCGTDAHLAEHLAGIARYDRRAGLQGRLYGIVRLADGSRSQYYLQL